LSSLFLVDYQKKKRTLCTNPGLFSNHVPLFTTIRVYSLATRPR
jgi:hypothetical protein